VSFGPHSVLLRFFFGWKNEKKPQKDRLGGSLLTGFEALPPVEILENERRRFLRIILDSSDLERLGARRLSGARMWEVHPRVFLNVFAFSSLRGYR
jgi:hypothetical protein